MTALFKNNSVGGLTQTLWDIRHKADIYPYCNLYIPCFMLSSFVHLLLLDHFNIQQNSTTEL